MDSKIIVLHEYGAPEHYQGLAFLAAQNGLNVEYREFGFVKQFAKGLINRDFNKIWRSVCNAFWLLTVWFGRVKKQRVVVGIAPFDWKLLMILPIISKNVCRWHTSWPHWDGMHYPKPIKSRIVEKAWSDVFKAKIQGVFFVTAHAQQNFLKYYSNKIPLSVVYHSYDPHIYYVREENNHQRRKNGLVVGFAGRLEESKGIHLILELAKREYSFPIKFLLAGKGPLQALVEQESCKNRERLEYKGFLPPERLSELYREIDYLLLPSLRRPDWEEAFGMVIIEAMACGAVPITTDHPGPVEILHGPLKDNVFSETEFINGTLDILYRSVRDSSFLERQCKEAIECASQFTSEAISNRWLTILDHPHGQEVLPISH